VRHLPLAPECFDYPVGRVSPLEERYEVAGDEVTYLHAACSVITDPERLAKRSVQPHNGIIPVKDDDSIVQFVKAAVHGRSPSAGAG
jgi:hypothetical protein